MDSESSASKSQVPEGQVECSQCTFFNSVHSEKCEMCDNVVFG